MTMTGGFMAVQSQDLNFTHVEFISQSYDHGIAIGDVVLQLRDIVGLSNLNGNQKVAADINGDGEVAIGDVVSNLRHIVGLDIIEQCALVSNSTTSELTLIQYGDVDLSATFLIA